MAFHQTTRLTDSQLRQAIESAARQEDRVHALFRRYGALSPSLAHKLHSDMGFTRTPLTSIRRCISDLTDLGKLSKTDIQVIGRYSVPESVWKLV
jgi:hypothetical protein